MEWEENPVASESTRWLCGRAHLILKTPFVQFLEFFYVSRVSKKLLEP